MGNRTRTTGRRKLRGYKKQGKSRLKKFKCTRLKHRKRKEERRGADVTGHLKGRSVECTCRTWLLRWSGLERTQRALALTKESKRCVNISMWPYLYKQTVIRVFFWLSNYVPCISVYIQYVWVSKCEWGYIQPEGHFSLVTLTHFLA